MVFFRFTGGQVSLPVILLISGIIIEIAIAGTFISSFLSSGGLGERLTARARTASLSGINDAMIKITRDKEWVINSCGAPYIYNLNVGDDSVEVSVCRVSDDPSNAYVYTIMSLATASNRKKNFLGTMTVDKTTGLVRLKNVVEAPAS